MTESIFGVSEMTDFGDYQYLVNDILNAMGDSELTTYEVAHKLHMAPGEVWDWLLILDEKKVITKSIGSDGRWRWKVNTKSQ